jgi:asparagine synthase (glutamine-hydrolysing)
MFASVSRQVRARKLTYLADSKLASMGECLDAVKRQGVAGDFLEFGVALGGSGICIASELDEGRRFFALDVFGMIPPPSAKDGAAPNRRYDEIRSGQSPGIGGETYYGYVANLRDVVEANFSAFDLSSDDHRIRFIEGLYHDTIPTLPAMRIAFCHIDCDWYDSVMLCLNYAAPRLSAGGMIVLDDYNDWEGCREATDEFCAAHPALTVKRTTPHAVLTKLF